MNGYVSSGRFSADIALEQAQNLRASARRYFRWGMVGEGKYTMRQAIREWKMYRFYRSRIVS